MIVEILEMRVLKVNKLTTLIKIRRRSLRNFAAGNSFLYYWVMRLGDKYNRLVQPDTKMVIDGFPRSGQSFLEAAFLLLNPDSSLAHHTHAPAQVELTARYKTPSLFVFRKPAESVASMLMLADGYYPTIINQSLREYIDFYDACLEYWDNIYIEPTGNALKNYVTTFERVNKRFGTQFYTVRQPILNDSEVFMMVDKLGQNRNEKHKSYDPNRLGNAYVTREKNKTEMRDLVENYADKIIYKTAVLTYKSLCEKYDRTYSSLL